MGDVPKRTGFLQLFDLLLRGLFLDHPHEDVGESLRLVLVLADDQVEHHVGGGHGNGTAVPVVGTVFDDAVLIHLELQDDVVAAAGVQPFEDEVRVLEVVFVHRMQVMIRQDLVVECVNRHSPWPP